MPLERYSAIGDIYRAAGDKHGAIKANTELKETKKNTRNRAMRPCAIASAFTRYAAYLIGSR